MSTAKFSTWLNPDGTENYKCRAWVNFNGTGTVAIRAAGNVSSITDNGTGNYTVNFTTAMPDVNYAFSFASQGIGLYGSTKTTSALQFLNYNSGFVLTDSSEISVAIFR